MTDNFILNKAARNMMGLSQNDSEAQIKSSISSWFLENDIKSDAEHRGKMGPSDLYLLRHRYIIEVKKHDRLVGGRNAPMRPGTGSKPDESAYEQLVRYVNDARRNSRIDGNKLQWMGAVTDGRRWWLWEWPQIGHGTEPEPVFSWQGNNVTPDNISRLLHLIKRENPGKQVPPSSLYNLFSDDLNGLEIVYKNQLAGYRDTTTQRELWLEQLKASRNHPEGDDVHDMFVKHTVLTLVSRIMSGLSDENVMEGFVGWTSDEAAGPIISSIREKIGMYDWRGRRGDILRELYHDMIGIKQRKKYGEYYTPDWLAEKICLDVIDNEYICKQFNNFRNGKDVNGILDPACGSGTFLYHAAKRLMASDALNRPDVEDEERNEFVCDMIYGIDINPIAVEMSIANMHRVLSGVRSDKFQIYQGDSLIASELVGTLAGATFNSKTVTLRSPKNNEITLPYAFLTDYDAIKKFVKSAVGGYDIPCPDTVSFNVNYIG